MTVAELIAELQQHPADLRVLVSGYEGGLTDPAPLIVRQGVVTWSDEAYHGKYATTDDAWDDLDQNAAPFDALVIPRG